MKLFEFTLSKFSDDDLRLFTARTPYSRDHTLVAALAHDPSVGDRLNIFQVPLNAQLKLGEAALQSESLRTRLITAWNDPALRLRSEYPGIALEPLVEARDEEAATIYAEWLPDSPYAWIRRGSIAKPSAGALRHPIVLEAARSLASRLIDNATVGRPDGSRVAKESIGDMLNHISSAWHDDLSVLHKLHEWLRAEDDQSFNGALWALWGIPLMPEIRATVEEAFHQRLASIHEGTEPSESGHHARSWLAWIDEMRLTTSLYALIAPLANTSTDLAYVAGAVILPLLSAEDAAALAAQMAPIGVTLDNHFLRHEFLRRYVLAAEKDWTAAAVDAIEDGLLVDESSGLRLMEFLSAENRAKIAEALLRSPASRAELHWVRQQDDYMRCIRPADIVRKVAFELGL